MRGPAEQVLSWAAGAVAPGARITGLRGLRAGANPWLLHFDRAGRTSAAILKVGDAGSVVQRKQLGTAVAALALAEENALAAPRVIAADLDGGAAGAIAMLTTVLPGSSEIPRLAPPGRLRQLGAAAAGLHAVPLAPRPGLPLRTSSLPEVDFVAWRRSAGTSELLARAEQRLSAMPVPGCAPVFIHGDLWQGNTTWSDGCCTGLIDWDCAGSGSPGIDLGSLRLDAALYFGLTAVGEILDGWQQAAGRPSTSRTGMSRRRCAPWAIWRTACRRCSIMAGPISTHARSLRAAMHFWPLPSISLTAASKPAAAAAQGSGALADRRTGAPLAAAFPRSRHLRGICETTGSAGGGQPSSYPFTQCL